MSSDLSADTADLIQLQDIPVDNVLNSIDASLVHLPTYRELYYRWERQQWRTQDIDFIPDRIQWEDMSEEEHDGFLTGLASFYQGEASVTDALSPFVGAVPDEEMRIFLTTQQVDEARHTVFFNRFFTEVVGLDGGRLEDTLEIARNYMSTASQYILIESLSDVAERIQREPGNLIHLIEGVTLYHIIIEGTMALAGQRALLEGYREENLFPSLRVGMIALTRDESRHVIFGVRFLRDMIQQDAAYTPTVIDAVRRFAPAAITALIPVDELVARMLERREDPWKVPRYAQESLRKKLKVIGLNIELPFVQPVPVFAP